MSRKIVLLSLYTLVLSFFVSTGCTSINLDPDLEPTGMEQYPSKEEQLKYDNFMLGRLKYIEADSNIDLITIAFIDARSNGNGKLDEKERQLLTQFKDQEKVYFTVGCPLYDPNTGREVDKGTLIGKPTNNPIDYYLPEDRPMWKGIVGCYAEFKDALRFFKNASAPASDLNRLWGIVEVDFTPLTFGKPAIVTQLWRVGTLTRKQNTIPVRCYRLKPEVCKLTDWNFKIIYLK